MCTGAEIALIGAAAIGAGSAIYSGQQQKAAAEYQADQAEADAIAEKGAAQVRAEKIRERARTQAAAARAAIAASGMNVNSQTSDLINEDIIRRGEMDAETGVNDSLDAAARLRAQATSLRSSGSAAQTAGYANAASTALTAYGGYKSGWYGSTEKPAPTYPPRRS